MTLKKYIAHTSDDFRLHTVKDHLYGTAELCELFLSKINIKNIGYIIGLFHDFGKYSDSFQEYIINSSKSDYNERVLKHATEVEAAKAWDVRSFNRMSVY